MLAIREPLLGPALATKPTECRQVMAAWEECGVERIRRTGIVATLTIDDPEDAVPLAEILVEAGLDVMELTLRTDTAITALRAIVQRVPEMFAGVGTVLQPEQVNEVADAGAGFALAPGTNLRVIQAAIRRGLPFVPGVATPSDIEAAIECGCRYLKFFPAEPLGGLAYLESMAAPYLHLGCRFVPIGGVNESHLVSYLRHPLVWAVGGSWIAPARLIQEKQWATIREQARIARGRVLEIRAK